MGFPLTPRSMTMDDHELLYGQILLEFRDVPRVSEAITAKGMNIDPYCQRRNCSPLNALQRCIGYVDIAGRSPVMGHQTSARWRKHTIFAQNASISLDSRDGANGCCITSGLSASAGLSFLSVYVILRNFETHSFRSLQSVSNP